MKPTSPFGPGWVYVTVVMRSIDGVCTQSQLWRNRKTGEQRWHKL
jgi:hypothetical protein